MHMLLMRYFRPELNVTFKKKEEEGKKRHDRNWSMCHRSSQRRNDLKGNRIIPKEDTRKLLIPYRC